MSNAVLLKLIENSLLILKRSAITHRLHPPQPNEETDNSYDFIYLPFVDDYTAHRIDYYYYLIYSMNNLDNGNTRSYYYYNAHYRLNFYEQANNHERINFPISVRDIEKNLLAYIKFYIKLDAMCFNEIEILTDELKKH